jgi:hypothetical protein
MQSPNKRPPSEAERAHILRIKDMDCIVCWAHGPSECHEIEQGLWFTSIPLCPDCHRGGFNGIHGQRRIWHAKKLTELVALNATIRNLMA